MILYNKKYSLILFLLFDFGSNIFGQIIEADSNATLIGYWESTDPVHSVYVLGNYAYLANYTLGLSIIDVSNPSDPSLVGLLPTGGPQQNALGITAVGSLVYIANGAFGGLRIIDVSNPSAPFDLGNTTNFGVAWDVSVSGSYAYLAESTVLRIIDISNSASPVTIGSWDSGGISWGVYVLGSYAYVADGSNGLRIIDISNPSAPVEVGFYETGGDIEDGQDVFVVDNYAYFADGANGLRIIDVSNPASPVEVGFFLGNISYSTQDVYVSDGYAYVAYGGHGLRIIAVSNPAAPTEVGFLDFYGIAKGVYVVGSIAYVADTYGSLYIIRNDLIAGIENENEITSSFFLNQNFPNPFNPSTKIKYSIPQTSDVVIKVFDILGNEIETLVNEEKPAGIYEINWYAENLSSGVYFYQLRAGDFIQTKKMVLLK